jgi:PadR family transcriptional regulator PadR
LDNTEKQFKKGILELVILKLLARKEMYGYELVAELNRRGCSLNVKEGTLYPILYRLEDDGLMETRWEQAASRGQPKKYYSVTKKGLLTMEDSYAKWKAIATDVMNIMEEGDNR